MKLPSSAPNSFCLLWNVAWSAIQGKTLKIILKLVIEVAKDIFLRFLIHTPLHLLILYIVLQIKLGQKSEAKDGQWLANLK